MKMLLILWWIDFKLTNRISYPSKYWSLWILSYNVRANVPRGLYVIIFCMREWIPIEFNSLHSKIFTYFNNLYVLKSPFSREYVIFVQLFSIMRSHVPVFFLIAYYIMHMCRFYYIFVLVLYFRRLTFNYFTIN